MAKSKLAGALPSLAVQDDKLLLDPAKRDELLDRLKTMGVDSIRTNVIWGGVRKGDGYDFSQQDALVNAARARGMKVQMTLMATPRYNQDQDQRLGYKDTNANLMGQFAKDVGTHFKGRVGRYSVGNEPNLFQTFNDAKDPALNYRRAYQAGHKALKGVDKGNQVMFGELMPGARGNADTADPRHAINFLRAVLRRGSKPLETDGVALHAYDQKPGMKNSPREYAGIQNLGGLTRELESQRKAGRIQTRMRRTPGVFITEHGYSKGEGTDQQRAARMAQGYDRARRAGARQFSQYQTDSQGAQWDTGYDDLGVLSEALNRVRRRPNTPLTRRPNQSGVPRPHAYGGEPYPENPYGGSY